MAATLEQNRLNTLSLLVLAAVAGGFALHWMRPVLVPFVLALMLAYLVAPLVDGLQVQLRHMNSILHAESTWWDLLL